MPSVRSTAALLALSLCSTGAQPARPPALTPAQIRQDLAVFEAAMQELHPSLHRYASRDEVKAFFENLGARADGLTNELDLYRALAPFATILRDGHTSLQRPAPLQNAAGSLRVLPVDVFVRDGRVWVTRSAAPALPPGSEILAIDDIAAAEVLARVMAAEPRDGHSESGPRYGLSRGFRFARQAAVLLGERPSHTVRVLPLGASAVTVTVATLPLQDARAAARPATAPAPAAPVSLETVDGIPVLTVRSFSGGISGELRDTIRSVVEHRRPALVIDVRGNGGGIDVLGLQLFGHIAAAPFEYYRELTVTAVSPPGPLLTSARVPELGAVRGADDRYRMTAHPNLGRHAVEAVNFHGRVVILMDGGSFSTTAEFLAAARASGRATFVGEESGGAACGNTSGASTMVVLPHSGLRLSVPLVRYEMAAPCDGRGRGVLPDVDVPVTIADVVAGGDRQRARALEIARTAPQLAAAPSISSETPVWAPDGSRLAFSSGPAMEHQIYVINADGTGARRLTDGSEQNRWPSWSPDGRTIVFMSDRDGQAELYVMNPDGTGQRRLTHTPVHEFAAAWSPRGDAIVYVTEMPGSKQQLFVMRADGGSPRKIDGDHLYYGRPAWAVDGSRIYVGAHRDPATTAGDRWKVGAHLYAYTPDGQSVEAVTPEGFASNPWPSPDGRQLLFDTGDGSSWSSARGEWNLWTLDLASGARTRLTSDGENDWGAAWSPDGRSVAFSSGRNRVYRLVVMAPNGTGRRVLTRTDRLPDAK